MFSVYRIETFEGYGNSHGIGTRNENWVVKKDSDFSSLEEAKNYVREKNRIFSPMVNYLARVEKQQEKEDFVEKFCFSDDIMYMWERRFFLGKPDVAKIKESLTFNGVVLAN